MARSLGRENPVAWRTEATVRGKQEGKGTTRGKKPCAGKSRGMAHRGDRARDAGRQEAPPVARSLARENPVAWRTEATVRGMQEGKGTTRGKKPCAGKSRGMAHRGDRARDAGRQGHHPWQEALRGKTPLNGALRRPCAGCRKASGITRGKKPCAGKSRGMAHRGDRARDAGRQGHHPWQEALRGKTPWQGAPRRPCAGCRKARAPPVARSLARENPVAWRTEATVRGMQEGKRHYPWQEALRGKIPWHGALRRPCAGCRKARAPPVARSLARENPVAWRTEATVRGMQNGKRPHPWQEALRGKIPWHGAPRRPCAGCRKARGPTRGKKPCAGKSRGMAHRGDRARDAGRQEAPPVARSLARESPVAWRTEATVRGMQKGKRTQRTQPWQEALRGYRSARCPGHWRTGSKTTTRLKLRLMRASPRSTPLSRISRVQLARQGSGSTVLGAKRRAYWLPPLAPPL